VHNGSLSVCLSVRLHDYVKRLILLFSRQAQCPCSIVCGHDDDDEIAYFSVR